MPFSLSSLSSSSSSSSPSRSNADNALTTLAIAAVTALVTYAVTKNLDERKNRKLRFQQYRREQEFQASASAKRVENKEPPSGTLVEGLSIDRVYAWQIEDLRQQFVSAEVENKIQNKAVEYAGTTIRSPMLRRVESSSMIDALREEKFTVRGADYNKLITDNDLILGDIVRKPGMPSSTFGYMRAGPRKLLHFDPKQVNAAIVTCGGLCPGLNNVIREITKTLHQTYGIGGHVYGIQAGYRGFYDSGSHLQPIVLTPVVVEDIHHSGGTCLGSSRGGFDLDKIIKFLKDKNICQLYVIGGDGTHRGAFAIHEGCMERGLNVSVAGIPKTIDNDVDYIDHSFGFSSAVEAAQVAIRTAKTEAVCNLPNGIGIVKLMGRSSGFIAAHATMASSDVDLCLVPEVPIVLEGEHGCLPHLLRRVKQQGYAVIVCAEGAGEELLGESAETDASGNKKLPKIGEYLKKVVEDYFIKRGETATVKYIDPSYMIRSVPANAADSLYCMQLAQNAVHGAMAGFTGFSVGLCNNRMVWLPIPEMVKTSPRHMDPHGRTWERVLCLTRQPNTVKPRPPGEASPHSYAPMLR